MSDDAMTEPRKTPRQMADDIMDDACLGVAFVDNGVDGALRSSIEKALCEAFNDGVLVGAEGNIVFEFNPPGSINEWVVKATWVEDGKIVGWVKPTRIGEAK